MSDVDAPFLRIRIEEMPRVAASNGVIFYRLVLVNEGKGMARDLILREELDRTVDFASSDPAPGFYISTTSLEDSSVDREDPRRYVNAESVNFFVLPGKLGLGAKLGDLGVIIRPDQSDYDYAVYADVGPASKIGEASIALADALGIPSSPKNGGTAHGIVYIVFPGSQQGWPLSQAEIDQYGSTLFAKWGGLEKAKDCFPDLPWS